MPEQKQQQQQHVCPYAAALSDDETDASSSHPDQDGPKQLVRDLLVGGGGDGGEAERAAALSAARKRCPAFADGAPCPFRSVGSDPTAMMTVMAKVPASHFRDKGSGAAEGAGDGMGGSATEERGKEEAAAAAAPFRLAMEHVHRVSSRLERGRRLSPKNGNDDSNNNDINNDGGNDNDNNGNDENQTTTNDDSSQDKFIVSGGCPFKSFHRDHGGSGGGSGASSGDGGGGSRELRLARAMEDFSLAAIMGRLASREELEGEEGEGGEADGGSEPRLAEEGEAISSVEDEQASNATAAAPPTSPTRTKEKDRRRRSSALSHALKVGTQESHSAAENVHFVKNFINGIIDRDLYAELVAGLHHTYVVLEALLDEHAPLHFPTLHFPKELGRTAALEEDMEFWHGANWRADPRCKDPSPAVKDYVDRMTSVADHDPLLLLAHAYTRYLGDLSGGKVLSRVARRALDLDRDGNGLRFYDFPDVKSAKAFKDRYRRALDELDLTSERVGAIVAEANVAFALNMRAFEELDVRGGVEGARVRDVGEALKYYDAHKEVDADARKDGEGEGEEKEAKCPFGFAGPNPHGSTSGGGKGGGEVPDADETMRAADGASSAGARSRNERGPTDGGGAGGGRCPWPFVFLHDPATGTRDWRTWAILGLVLCWCWSRTIGAVE
ncbi:hypothetical protein ACHAWF_002936 [Thalassiosira exigua]